MDRQLYNNRCATENYTPNLEAVFDLVFIDAEKVSYDPSFWKLALKKCRFPGSVYIIR